MIDRKTERKRERKWARKCPVPTPTPPLGLRVRVGKSSKETNASLYQAHAIIMLMGLAKLVVGKRERPMGSRKKKVVLLKWCGVKQYNFQSRVFIGPCV